MVPFFFTTKHKVV